MPSIVVTAAAIVDRLQLWIEDRDDLSTHPMASFTYTRDTLSIMIGEETVYCDQEGGHLSFERCRDSFLASVADLTPFYEEARNLTACSNCHDRRTTDEMLVPESGSTDLVCGEECANEWIEERKRD